MGQDTDCRIVWLVPGQGFKRIGTPRYTLPLLQEFQRAYPGVTYITTGTIDPFYRKILNIRSRGNLSWSPLRPSSSSIFYGRGFNHLSPAIVFDLLKLKPKIVISQELTIWTILSAMLKRVGGWKLLVLWTGSSPGVNLVDDSLRLFVRKLVTQYTDAFVTNSFGGKHYLEQYLHAPSDRVFRIIYKPGDPSALSQKPVIHSLMHKARRPQFLYVGQLIPRKGLTYLLSAWSKFQELSPDAGSLLIIGSGPQQDELMLQVSTLGLKEVHFIGQVDYASLGSWYQTSDVFVFPTLEDIWANVVPEAMAFGKPILCSLYAGAQELLCHDENGFIFEPRDTNGLANLMLNFVDAPQLIENFSRKSKEIMESYTIATAVKAIQEILNPLLKV
jgi:glycosyltransferase involved in cell wall biosynthesis